MLGDLINRGLVMLFGYAVPAFECYKTVEKNRVEINQLRFWCQYWIIVALLTVLERFGDVFVSWLPMYGEMKVVFFVYLWYPKTKGTSFVYDVIFRPYVAKHETEIERKLLELRARAWDFAVFHWENCADYGQTTFFHILQYFASKSSNPNGSLQTIDQQLINSRAADSGRRQRQTERKPIQQSSKSRWPWAPSPSAPPMKRLESQSSKSDIVQEELPHEISLVATMMNMDPNIFASDDRTDPPPVTEEAGLIEKMRAALRQRRSQSRSNQ